HTVDNRFSNAIKGIQNMLYLSGGNVFTFPTEGITQAIHKLSVFVANISHQVAGVKVSVAFFKGVANNGFFGFAFIGIAIIRRALGDFANEQTWLAFFGFD